MAEKRKTTLVRKIGDYTLFGLGISALVDGVVRIARNPPEHVLNWYNLDNYQLQFGYISTLVGGAGVAYGIERIIKYFKE